MSRVSFAKPAGLRLPRVIDATTPQDKLLVIQGKAEFRALVLDGYGSPGPIMKVIVRLDEPEFTVTVKQPTEEK